MGNVVTWTMCANSGGHAARENTRVRREQFPLRGSREMSLAERLSDWKALAGAGAAGTYIQRCRGQAKLCKQEKWGSCLYSQMLIFSLSILMARLLCW